MNNELRFADPATMADALCAAVVSKLQSALSARRKASLIVSGGRTPLPLFERLTTADIAWSAVYIALADERWVHTDDPGSNERFVRAHLLRGRAAAANFIGMKNESSTAALGAARAWSDYAPIPRPFDCVLLGMGDDGHTASLFSSNSNLAAALDGRAVAGCTAMRAPVVPHERLSLNLAALTDARDIIVSSSGDSKWQVFQSAKGAGSALNMPIRAILRQQKAPVGFYWSP